MTNTHFHANMIEETAGGREATALGDSFETREAAQTAMLKETGSLAGQPLWTLTSANVRGSEIDVIEFLNRDGRGLTLSVWECSCSQG